MRRCERVFALMAAALGAFACGGDGGPPAPGPPPAPPPVGGVVTAAFLTPNVDDAALMILISGPGPIGAPEAVNGGVLLSWRPTESGFTAALFGDLAAGPLLRFRIPDLDRIAVYRATIVDVADAQSVLRPGLGGYGVTISK